MDPGVYSDFQEGTAKGIRVPGHAAAIYTWSPTTKIVFGAAYLDRRCGIDVIPIGGMIWKPRDDLHFELVFPHPKIAWRIDPGGSRTTTSSIGSTWPASLAATVGRSAATRAWTSKSATAITGFSWDSSGSPSAARSSASRWAMSSAAKSATYVAERRAEPDVCCGRDATAVLECRRGQSHFRGDRRSFQGMPSPPRKSGQSPVNGWPRTASRGA